MSKESIFDAITATEASIRNVQRATRHRSDWLFVRVETLQEWAATNVEESVRTTATPEALTRIFFSKSDIAPVRQGTDGTGAALLAIWCREGEPTYDPPWDGMPPWMREAIPNEVSGPVGVLDQDGGMGFIGLFAIGATGAGSAPAEGETIRVESEWEVPMRPQEIDPGEPEPE